MPDVLRSKRALELNFVEREEILKQRRDIGMRELWSRQTFSLMLELYQQVMRTGPVSRRNSCRQLVDQCLGTRQIRVELPIRLGRFGCWRKRGHRNLRGFGGGRWSCLRSR